MAFIRLDENNYWTGDMSMENQFPDGGGIEIEELPENFIMEDGIAWQSYHYENGALVFDEERYATLKAEHDASIEKIETTPTAEEDLMSMTIDHEYRITMLELFSNTVEV